MPRDDRTDPLERFRDPQWSEEQAAIVQAMQPERSPDPNDQLSAYGEYLQKRNRELFRKVLELTDKAVAAEYLARHVVRMDFTGHRHLVRSTCVYCDAKRIASELLGEKHEEASDE